MDIESNTEIKMSLANDAVSSGPHLEEYSNASIDTVVRLYLDLPFTQRLLCLRKIMVSFTSSENATLKTYLEMDIANDDVPIADRGPTPAKKRRLRSLRHGLMENGAVVKEEHMEASDKSISDNCRSDYSTKNLPSKSDGEGNFPLSTNAVTSNPGLDNITAYDQTMNSPMCIDNINSLSTEPLPSPDIADTPQVDVSSVQSIEDKDKGSVKKTEMGRRKVTIKLRKSIRQKKKTTSLSEKAKKSNSPEKRKGKKTRQGVECTDCGKCFSTELQCDVHMLGHDVNGPSIIDVSKLFKDLKIMSAENNPENCLSVNMLRRYCRQNYITLGVSKAKCLLCDSVYTEINACTYHVISQHLIPATLYKGATVLQKNKGSSSGDAYRAKLASVLGGKDRILSANHLLVQCPLCTVTFSNKSSFQYHVQSVHAGLLSSGNTFKHQCNKCKRTFNTKLSLNAHEKEHLGEYADEDLSMEGITTERVLLCKHCGHPSRTTGEREEHQNLHTDTASGLWTCEVCKLSFTQVEEWQAHVDKGHLMCLCPVCPKLFYTKKDLDGHLRYSNNHMPSFCCDLCGRSFAQEPKLKIHQEVDHEGCIKCSQCTKTFATSIEVEEHQETAHPKRPQCDLCDKTFCSKSELKYHAERIHYGDGGIKRKCVVCNEEFELTEDLRLHMLNEHGLILNELGSKKFKCPHCPFSANIKTVLRKHMVTHQKIRYRRFKCDECDKTFLQKYSLKMHKVNFHFDSMEVDGEKSSKGSTLDEAPPSTNVNNSPQAEAQTDSSTQNTEVSQVMKTGLERINVTIVTQENEIKASYSKKAKQYGPARRVTKNKTRKKMKQGIIGLECLQCGQFFSNKLQCDFHLLEHDKNGPAILDAAKLFKELKIMNAENNPENYLSVNMLRRFCRQKYISLGVNKSKCLLCDSVYSEINGCTFHVITSHLIAPSLYKKATAPTRNKKDCSDDAYRAKLASVIGGKDRILSANHQLVQCPLCTITFCQKTGFQHHMETVHAGSVRRAGAFRHQCNKCKRTFDTKLSIDAHEKEHLGELAEDDINKEGFTTERMLLCKHCGHPSKTEGERDIHQNQHVDIPTSLWTCKVCKLSFIQGEEWQAHVDNGHLMCQCPICPKLFYTKKELDGHLRTSNNHISTFCCEICGKSFAQEAKLKSHQEVDHEGRIKCRLCTRTFATRDEAEAHEVAKHPQRPQCDLCSKSFSNKTELKYHTESVHYGNGKMKRKCPICDKEFALTEELELHMKKDHFTTLNEVGFKNLKCPHCPYFTNRKSTMNKHIAIHQKRNRSFQCDECEKTFLTNHALKKHKEIYHSGMVYMCDICGKELKGPHILARHKDWHLGIKRYPCEYCSQSFTQKQYWNKHMKRYHPNEFMDTLQKLPIGLKARWASKYPNLVTEQNAVRTVVSSDLGNSEEVENVKDSINSS